jgi:hypothetical protein
LEPEAPALEVSGAGEVVAEASEVPSRAFKAWSFLSSQSLEVGQRCINLILSMTDDVLHCRFEGGENLVLRIVEFIEKLCRTSVSSGGEGIFKTTMLTS